MKRSSYPIYFTSITLLTLVLMTSGCSQPVNVITKTIMLPEEVPLELVWIPPGSFLMGSPEDEQARYDFESPQHEVTITEGFWMSKYEITQLQWLTIMGNNPSSFKGDNRPVEMVSWNDIRGTEGYLEQLNEKHPGYNFRLPSEAEWEYAYRAGTTTRFYWGDDLNHTQIDDYAWYEENSGGETHEVGQKLPNAWGLYDMAGNVWEWCEDDWHWDYLDAPNDGSPWVRSPRGSPRLLRGGSWDSHPNLCRAADRRYYSQVSRYFIFGFRVVFALD